MSNLAEDVFESLLKREQTIAQLQAQLQQAQQQLQQYLNNLKNKDDKA